MPVRKDSPLRWTPPQEMALKLTFEGRWTRHEIARKLVEMFRADGGVKAKTADAQDDAQDHDALPTPEQEQVPASGKKRAQKTGSAPKFSLSVRALDGWLAHPEFQARLAEMRADFAASVRDVAYADKARRIIALDQMAEAARRQFEERPLLKEIRPTPLGDVTNEAFNRDAYAAFRESLDDIAKELGHRKQTEATISIGNVQVVFAMPQPEQPPADVLPAGTVMDITAVELEDPDAVSSESADT